MKRCGYAECRGVMFAEPPDSALRDAFPEIICSLCARGEHEPVRIVGPTAVCNRLGCLRVALRGGLCQFHQNGVNRLAATR